MKPIVEKRALLLRRRHSFGRAILWLLVVSFWASQAQAGLAQYRYLVLADRHRSSAPPKEGVRITYLGTNAYLLESRELSLLIDPYFSRVSLCRVASNLPLTPDRDLIQRYLPTRRVDAVLVTHGQSWLHHRPALSWQFPRECHRRIASSSPPETEYVYAEPPCGSSPQNTIGFFAVFPLTALRAGFRLVRRPIGFAESPSLS
jgi:Beta-lactamase superfamily domain